MSTQQTIPYTYFIKWTNLNKWYYGVRYANGCNPDEFWKKYFTSSDTVKKLLKEHGDPNVIQIRKSFSDFKKAIDWEKRVLKKMKVLNRNDSLNMNIAGSIVIPKEKYIEMAKKRKETRKHYNGNIFKEKNPMWKKFWITNGTESKVISLNEKIPDGWYKGRKISLYVKNKENGIPYHFKNTVWITDGYNNKRVNENSDIPKGWKKGHTVKDKNSIKGSGNTVWITDGIDNIKMNKNLNIPDGWKRGRTILSKKQGIN